MNARRTMVLAMFAAIASSAAGCAAGDSDLDQLDAQREIWESHQIENYAIEVIGLSGTASVDRVFDEAERAIEVGADVSIEWDELGFPRWISIATDGRTHEIGVTFFQIDSQVGPEQGELRPVRPPRPTPGFDIVVEVEPAPDRPPGSIFTPIGQPRAPGFSVVAQ